MSVESSINPLPWMTIYCSNVGLRVLSLRNDTCPGVLHAFDCSLVVDFENFGQLPFCIVPYLLGEASIIETSYFGFCLFAEGRIRPRRAENHGSISGPLDERVVMIYRVPERVRASQGLIPAENLIRNN